MPGERGCKLNPNNPTILDFFEFIYDRHEIYYKRFQLKRMAPWSKDALFQKFSFCNAYRELDRGTIHLIKNIIESKDYDLNEKIFNVLLYRKFNTSYFFKHLSKISPYNYKPEIHIKEMQAQLDAGIKLWKNAYMVAPPRIDKQAKHIQMMNIFIPISKDIAKFTSELKSQKSLKDAHKFIKENVPLTGGFLAQQYLIDICYIPEMKVIWNLNKFVDVGPGAKPAAKLLFPNLTPEEACHLLYETQHMHFGDLKDLKGKDWKKIYYREAIAGAPWLRISDIQNCLCEFRKYCHLQTNPNKKKRYYKGA